MEKVEKRIAAQKILASAAKSDDQKLNDVFELYKEDLQQEYSQLYYALLGWKYAHFQELTRTRQVVREIVPEGTGVTITEK